MGEWADMALEGVLCECCGQPLVDDYGEEASGYPMLCDACQQKQEEE